MIQSPSFPQPYADHIQCTWMIRVDYDRRILLNFIDMDLGQGLHCKETYLAVHDGFAAKDGVPATKRCGQAYFLKKGESEFKSKNHRVVIRFMSGENEDRSTGFRIAWTAVKLPDLKQDKNGNWYEEACEGFHCEGGEYCIDTSGLLCNPLPRYCIAKSLQCNGVPNCGASDHSDENGCYKQIITIIGAIAGFVLTTASVSGITIFCMRRQKRIKKEKQNEALNMTLEKLESSPSLKRHVGPFNDVQDSPRKNPVAAYGVVEWCNSNNYHHNTISPESARVDYMSIRRSSPARSPIAVRLGGGRAPHAYHMVVCSDSDESHSVTV